MADMVAGVRCSPVVSEEVLSCVEYGRLLFPERNYINFRAKHQVKIKFILQTNQCFKMLTRQCAWSRFLQMYKKNAPRIEHIYLSDVMFLIFDFKRVTMTTVLLV